MLFQLFFGTTIVKQLNNTRNISVIFVCRAITVNYKRIPIVEQNVTNSTDLSLLLIYCLALARVLGDFLFWYQIVARCKLL